MCVFQFQRGYIYINDVYKGFSKSSLEKQNPAPIDKSVHWSSGISTDSLILVRQLKIPWINHYAVMLQWIWYGMIREDK